MPRPEIHAEIVSTDRSGSQPRRISGLCLLRLAKGRTRWTVDGKTCDLREGDVVALFPGQVFSGLESAEGVPIRVEQVSLELGGKRNRFGAEWLSRALGIGSDEAGTVARALQSAVCRVIRVDPERGRGFAEIVALSDVSSDVAAIHRKASFLHLVTNLCLAIEQGGVSDIRRITETETAVARFLLELEKKCDEEWTLEDMAEGAGLKRSRFGVLCRRLTGESPATYLNRLRVRRSRQLLRDTDRTITEIGFDCGFSSSQYFAKIFRRFQGHEPSHYRKIARAVAGGKGLQYLKGDSARNVAFAEEEVGSGDFRVEGTISLDRLGDTAASLEFGPDRFGFDGREGRFFLEGETVGEAQFFERSADLIREGLPFQFFLERKGKDMSISLDGQLITRWKSDPKQTVGRVGLRPLRNGIRVSSFQVDGREVVLR